jgi:hypothetical protein
MVNSQRHDLAIGLPDMSTVGAPVYANVAHANSTPYDFRLTFSLLTVPHDEAGDPTALAGMVMAPRAVVQVVIPAGAVESVVDLLRAELDRYIDEFGPPRPTVVRSAAASTAAGSG